MTVNRNSSCRRGVLEKNLRFYLGLTATHTGLRHLAAGVEIGKGIANILGDIMILASSFHLRAVPH